MTEFGVTFAIGNALVRGEGMFAVSDVPSLFIFKFCGRDDALESDPPPPPRL